MADQLDVGAQPRRDGSTTDDGGSTNGASASGEAGGTAASTKSANGRSKKPKSNGAAPDGGSRPARARAKTAKAAKPKPAALKAATVTEPEAPRARGTRATTGLDADEANATALVSAHAVGAGADDTKGVRVAARLRGQLRARRVHRILRRIDPWSVLKLSLIFYTCVWLMAIIAVVLLWGVAVGSGTVSSLENFIAEFLAFEEFHFNGDQLFQIVALGGLIGVFISTAVTAVLAVLFNLIADLTGGIRVTVIEEETTRRVVAKP